MAALVGQRAAVEVGAGGDLLLVGDVHAVVLMVQMLDLLTEEITTVTVDRLKTVSLTKLNHVCRRKLSQVMHYYIPSQAALTAQYTPNVVHVKMVRLLF